jgi:hypothetical protein
MIDFINQNWIGSLIGLIGLVVALCIYRASRIGARPVYQSRAFRLIGVKEQALPNEVAILYSGRNVQRLTKTYIILWNSGKAIVEGKDIVIDDPLRLEFSEGSEVLSARVIKETHKPNKFMVNINQQSNNIVFINFEYLNAQDGVTLELLHTSQERYPLVKGSIKGIPKGISDWGLISSPRVKREFPFNLYQYKTMAISGIIAGIVYILIGVFAPSSPDSNNDIIFKKVSIGIGIFAILLFSLFPLLFRRRFPKSLSIDDVV